MKLLLKFRSKFSVVKLKIKRFPRYDELIKFITHSPKRVMFLVALLAFLREEAKREIRKFDTRFIE